jgi:microsomal dipeptidase-like Zn-dependent dipeptidase
LVSALQNRGFGEGEIRKICGLNLKNFLRRVEKKGGGA